MAKEEFNYSALKILWDWLCSKYEFKRDVIKNRILWRDATKKIKGDFNVLQDEELNTISIEAGLQGLKQSSPKNITMFLYSNYTPTYNPILEYLERVSKKRPMGIIHQLSKCITTQNAAAFERYLRKWLASSVANVVNKYGCQNHTCLTFTGNQFAGKTTFFEWLCPKELKDYLFTGEIDLRSKDSLWKLAEYWFVNIEEQIKALNKQDANTMKQLITLPHVKGRKPYGRLEATGYRIANFTASTNDDDFLTDPTGSRRFLCFKIDKINDDKKTGYQSIDIDELWAEAYWYYKNNPVEYYVTAKDIEEVQENNKQFVHLSQEQEYININLLKPNTPGKKVYVAPSTVIRDYLRAVSLNQTLKERNVGIALKNNGYEQISHRVKEGAYPVKGWRFSLVNDANDHNLCNYTINV